MPIFLKSGKGVTQEKGIISEVEITREEEVAREGRTRGEGDITKERGPQLHCKGNISKSFEDMLE